MNVLRNYQLKAISDIQQAYKNNYKAPCLVAPCGAGKSIIVAEMAKRTTDKKNRVLFIVHRQELCEQIRNTFEWWGVDMNYCQIGMVQTICRRLSKTQEPKLIIIDENHHVLANSYKKILNHFSNSYKIGVTATPVRLSGEGLQEINDILINTVSCKWLIENKFLSPFKYFAPEVADFSKLKTKRGDFVIGDVDEIVNQRSICGDVINHYSKIAEGKKAICYCASISHSKRMAEMFGEIAAHIDGDTPDQERKEIIDKFRSGEIKILCNVDIISEGFDVPNCEVAILLRPTQSLTLFIQQSMRCMRYQEGKTAIILDHVGNCRRHGLPDMNREWTLEGKKRNKQEKSEISIRQCPECYFTHEVEPECPNCGHVYQIKERRELTQTEGELKEVNEITIDYRNPEDCSSMSELIRLAKSNGYKTGWAYYQGKRLGLMR